MPEQQPTQFCAVHVGVTTQAPDWHFPLCGVQSWHCAPGLPHALSVVGATQRLPWQQPFGQFCELHSGGGPLQVPVWALQVWPFEAQSEHWRPPMPQVFASVPGTHAFPAQQPLQFCGPHEGATQLWEGASQTVPFALQSVQEFPPVPQATPDVPVTQTFLPLKSRQQPVGQLSESQVG